MYCPRCSQEQVSEETKFCSRCGFPLGLVSEVLSHGGFLPQLAELHKSKSRLTRRNGVLFSVFWFMFFVLILCPFFGIINVDKLAGASAIVGIFGGLMWLIAALVLLKTETKPFAQMYDSPNADARNFSAAANQKNLPPPQTPPAQSYVPPATSWRTPDTGELVQPRSVVEGTTKLLKKDE